VPFIRYTARQETVENVMRLMCFACWITEATNIHSEYVIFLVLYGTNGYTIVLQFYIYTYTASILSLIIIIITIISVQLKFQRETPNISLL
jgi:hypothetical protein